MFYGLDVAFVFVAWMLPLCCVCGLGVAFVFVAGCGLCVCGLGVAFVFVAWVLPLRSAPNHVPPQLGA